MSTVDYKASLDFAERINQVTSNGKKLSESFFYNRYNIWYFYQAAIFNDAKFFNKTQAVSQHHRFSLKAHCVSLLLLIVSIYSGIFLWVTRRKVMFFSVDASTSAYKGDFRMESLYKLLHKKSIVFFESFHTVPSKKTLKNIVLRKRPALYLESIDYLFYVTHFFRSGAHDESIISGIDFSHFSKSEQQYAKSIIKKYITSIPLVVFRIQVWKFLLRWIGVRLVLSIDDVRSYNELLVACNELGITSYVFQHGHYSKYHRGFLTHDFSGEAAVPTTVFVWNSYWKQELSRLNSIFPDSIVTISGATADVSGYHGGIEQKNHNDGISILIPYETDAPKSEVKAYIAKILSDSDIHIIFKIRPDRDKLMQINEYGIPTDNSRVEIVRSLHEVVGDVTLVCGVYSTFLYDMIAIKKPVCMFDTSMDYGEGLIYNGLAERISLKDCIDEIQRIAKTSEEVLTKRFDTLEGESPKDFDTTISEYLNTNEII